MLKILQTRYRYPLFFLGILIMEMAGVLYKLVHISTLDAEIMVIPGFIIFAFSILAT